MRTVFHGTIEVIENPWVNVGRENLKLSKHQPNNQICILRQSIVDNYLKFVKSFTLK